MTYFIKQGIEWSEELTGPLMQEDSVFRVLIKHLPFWRSFIDPFMPSLTSDQVDTAKKQMDMPQAEAIQWLISFVIAYLLVENAGEIINAGANIIGVAKGMIGMLAK